MTNITILKQKIAYHLNALQIMGEQIMGESDMGALPARVAVSFHNAVEYLSDVHDYLQNISDRER